MSRFLDEDVWDTPTIEILRASLDEATQRAQIIGVTADQFAEPIRDELARAIVDLARNGVRDRDHLVELALKRTAVVW